MVFVHEDVAQNHLEPWRSYSTCKNDEIKTTSGQEIQNSHAVVRDAVLTKIKSQKTEPTEPPDLTTWTKTRTSVQIGKEMCEIMYPGFQH